MSDSESEAEEVLDISDPEVLAKYRLSAEIANREFLSFLGPPVLIPAQKDSFVTYFQAFSSSSLSKPSQAPRSPISAPLATPLLMRSAARSTTRVRVRSTPRIRVLLSQPVSL